METTEAKLNSCLGFMKDSLKTVSQAAEVLLMKTAVVKRVKELTTPLPPDMLKPNTEATIIFSSPADFTTACQSYGQLSSRSHPTGKGAALEVATRVENRASNPLTKTAKSLVS